MKDSKLGRRILISILGTSLAACVGSSDPTVAGIDGTGSSRGIVYGTISGFGSVIVNGVHFDTSNATFTIDGQPGTQSDLSAGDVVLVQGTIDSSHDNGSAESVSFDDIVEGPIESIALDNRSLLVMGQTVLVDDGTSFDDDIAGRSPAGLMDGDVVEVSGFVNSSGDIVATRIERKQPGGQFEVTGVVQNFNSADLRFNINDLIVDFSTTTMINGFATGMPSEGDRVEVKGLSFVAGVLVATEVEYKGSEIDLDDVDRAEFEGLITDFVSVTEFKVASQPTTTNEETEFEHGTVEDLGNDVEVEVEGQIMQINGVDTLVADEVEFHRTHKIRIEAPVVVANGTLSMLGITVVTNSVTRFEDHGPGHLETFGLVDIGDGDFLEIRGFEEPSGTVVATRVERDDSEPEVKLRGFVEPFIEPDLVILGVTIQTDLAPTEFEDVNGDPITADEFFGAVAVGTLVEVEGTFDGNEIIATEVEFED